MTIDELRASLGDASPAYKAKQLHSVPNAPVVNRREFIVGRCKNKIVLDIGASGSLHDALVAAAKTCYGISLEGGPDVLKFDLDDMLGALPVWREMPEIVVCGEVIEHLSNPGHFLKRLRRAYPVPVIVTVPNAFNEINQQSLREGVENCNRDHVAWYSPRTIKTLLERAGYAIMEFAWYKGKPKFAEGMIVVAE